MKTKGNERPVFWIVAGPNGCGKSTAYGRNDLSGVDGSVWIINPDLLTVRIRDSENLPLLDANLAAVQRIERWLDASLDTHQTIGVETVLSSGKYRRLVEKAKKLGFEVRLFYVIVKDAALQVERIQYRVAKGGHDVPTDKVFDRRARSLTQMLWFIDHADRFFIFDNSGAESQLIGEGDADGVNISGKAPKDLLAAVEMAWREGLSEEEILPKLRAMILPKA